MSQLQIVNSQRVRIKFGWTTPPARKTQLAVMFSGLPCAADVDNDRIV